MLSVKIYMEGIAKQEVNFQLFTCYLLNRVHWTHCFSNNNAGQCLTAFFIIYFILFLFSLIKSLLQKIGTLLICLLSKKNKAPSSLIEREMVLWHSSSFEHNLRTLEINHLTILMYCGTQFETIFSGIFSEIFF